MATKKRTVKRPITTRNETEICVYNKPAMAHRLNDSSRYHYNTIIRVELFLEDIFI